MPDPKSFSPPLTETHKRRLNQALSALAELVVELDKGERAGFDVTEQRQRCKHLMGETRKIRDVFFPGLA